MAHRTTGRYVRTVAGGEEVLAFHPEPLPPANPPLRIDGLLERTLRRAESALGQLEASGELVPSVTWLLYSFVRKEAVLSSRIEGTQSTLLDLFTYEASGAPASEEGRDVVDVCNYLDALEYARKQLHSRRGLPLSVRLLNEAHRCLLRGTRGSGKQPGEIRRSQNWIGGTRPGNAAFVPPPPQELGRLLGELEAFLHAEDPLPPLVRAGLAHVQFETIHPYLDGNGRIGRLLVTLLLEERRLLTRPLLYLSLHFQRNRAEYYRRLDAVRTEGDFEGWLAFFLDGVAAVSLEAVGTAKALFRLVSEDRAKALASPGSSVTALRLFELLPEHPVVTVASGVRLLGTTKPTAAKAVGTLIDAGILSESTGRKRDRTYVYKGYLEQLRGEAEG